MAEQGLGGTFRQTKSKRIVRRLVELVVAAALLGVALYELGTIYFPITNTGLVYLGALIVVLFVCLLLLRK